MRASSHEQPGRRRSSSSSSSKERQREVSGAGGDEGADKLRLISLATCGDAKERDRSDINKARREEWADEKTKKIGHRPTNTSTSSSSSSSLSELLPSYRICGDGSPHAVCGRILTNKGDVVHTGLKPW